MTNAFAPGASSDADIDEDAVAREHGSQSGVMRVAPLDALDDPPFGVDAFVAMTASEPPPPTLDSASRARRVG